jgi:hypothetical protein
LIVIFKCSASSSSETEKFDSCLLTELLDGHCCRDIITNLLMMLDRHVLPLPLLLVLLQEQAAWSGEGCVEGAGRAGAGGESALRL